MHHKTLRIFVPGKIFNQCLLSKRWQISKELSLTEIVMPRFCFASVLCFSISVDLIDVLGPGKRHDHPLLLLLKTLQNIRYTLFSCSYSFTISTSVRSNSSSSSLSMSTTSTFYMYYMYYMYSWGDLFSIGSTRSTSPIGFVTNDFCGWLQIRQQTKC